MLSLDLCRICENQSNLVDLSKYPNYIEQYLIVSNVSYDIDDGLPQFFCRFCITQLLHFVKFKQKCEETYRKFQNNVLQMQTNVIIKTELIINDYQNNDWSYVTDNSKHAGTKTMIDDINLQLKTELHENQDDNDDNVSLLTVLTYESDKDYENSVDNTGNIKDVQKLNEIQHRNDNIPKMRQLICDICKTDVPMVFENMNLLELHMTVFHRMIKNLRQCEQCGENSKWFTLDRLHNHNFTCKYCFKVFQQKSHYISHTRIHTNERPFKCEFCNNGFKQKQHLLNHHKTRIYKCKHCRKCFFKKAHFNSHTMSCKNPIYNPLTWTDGLAVSY